MYPISNNDLTLGEADYPVNRQQATLSPRPFEDSLRDDMHNGLRDDIHDDLHDDIQDDIQGQFSTLLDEVLPPPEKQSTPCSAPFISGIVNGIASLYDSPQGDDAIADRLATAANAAATARRSASACLVYPSPRPRDRTRSSLQSSACQKKSSK